MGEVYGGVDVVMGVRVYRNVYVHRVTIDEV